jgi:hypothetical protein
MKGTKSKGPADFCRKMRMRQTQSRTQNHKDDNWRALDGRVVVDGGHERRGRMVFGRGG